MSVQEGVNLGGRNKIIEGEAVYRMGGEAGGAAVIANFEIGVVVFPVSNPGHCVDEGDGLIIVLELE